jgi:hypothetical protein
LFQYQDTILEQLELHTSAINHLYTIFDNANTAINATIDKNLKTYLEKLSETADITRHQIQLNRQYLTRIETFMLDKVSDINQKLIILFGIMVLLVFLQFCVFLYTCKT